MSSRTIDTNSGSTPGVAARTSSIPAAAARFAATTSRSWMTSMWSDTNPIGTTTTAGTLAAASASMWSPMSGVEPGLRRRGRCGFVRERPREPGCTALGDESGGLAELGDVVGSLGHRDRKAVRREHDATRARVGVSSSSAAASDRANGPDVARVVVELAELVDHRRSGADLRHARPRCLSRYWRHEEYELNPEVTKASARSTPSSRIWRTASTR